MKKFFIIVGMLLLIAIPPTVVSARVPAFIDNNEINQWEMVEEIQQNSDKENVCTGYDVKIDEPGSYSDEVNLTVTKEKVTWSANPGYVITAVCIKEGGPGGGTLYTPNVANGQYDKQFYDISHAAISWDEIKEPGDASASVELGACEYVKGPSRTNVIITLDHASLTINGETYTQSTTIVLGPGTYPYSWEANEGYTGSGFGDLVVRSCKPGDASASVELSTCGIVDGTSLTSVIINVNHASLTINDVTYTENTTIKLEPGTYNYSWEANEEGYSGVGSGTLVVESCESKEQAEAEITFSACQWIENENDSFTDVFFALSGASLTISSTSGSASYGPYTGSGSVTLPAGGYTYDWTAVEGYSGSGDGSFTLGTCEPGVASASVELGACDFSTGISLTPVTINVNHASLTINEVTYTEAATINLEPGTYKYSWEANEEGYTGKGSGKIVVDDCSPKQQAEAEVTPGACKWNTTENESFTKVAFKLSGASLTISSTSASYGPYTESGSVELPAGEYTYNWTAVDGNSGSGEGAFTLLSCEPGKSSASLVVGSCSFASGKSLTPVTINVNHASLTINSVTYIEGVTINLLPGNYDYSWKTNEEDFTGEGSGSIVVDSCEPKEEEKDEKPVDPKPDIAAGGSGPSLILLLAPATMGISSLGLAWTVIKKKRMNS